MTEPPPEPLAPTTTSWSMASCKVLAREVYQVTVTLLDWVKLPSQWKFPIEVCRPRWPVASKISKAWLASVRKVPSRGASMAAWFMARSPPPPGWLITTKWIARNVLAVMPAEQAQIEIIAVARRPIGRQRDGLASIEQVGRMRVLAAGNAGGQDGET